MQKLEMYESPLATKKYIHRCFTCQLGASKPEFPKRIEPAKFMDSCLWGCHDSGEKATIHQSSSDPGHTSEMRASCPTWPGPARDAREDGGFEQKIKTFWTTENQSEKKNQMAYLLGSCRDLFCFTGFLFALKSWRVLTYLEVPTWS